MMLLLLACGRGGFVVSEGSPGIGVDAPGLSLDSGTDDCSDETGGAEFAFVFGEGRSMDIWVTNDEFIDWYLADQPGWPVFNELIYEVGCDADYDWHPSPVELEWANDYRACSDEIPVSSAAPEAPWCVTDFSVESVDDRR